MKEKYSKAVMYITDKIICIKCSYKIDMFRAAIEFLTRAFDKIYFVTSLKKMNDTI